MPGSAHLACRLPAPGALSSAPWTGAGHRPGRRRVPLLALVGDKGSSPAPLLPLVAPPSPSRASPSSGALTRRGRRRHPRRLRGQRRPRTASTCPRAPPRPSPSPGSRDRARRATPAPSPSIFFRHGRGGAPFDPPPPAIPSSSPSSRLSLCEHPRRFPLYFASDSSYSALLPSPCSGRRRCTCRRCSCKSRVEPPLLPRSWSSREARVRLRSPWASPDTRAHACHRLCPDALPWQSFASAALILPKSQRATSVSPLFSPKTVSKQVQKKSGDMHGQYS